MTGTAKQEVEFEKTYKLATTIIPTNRIRARFDFPDQVYKTAVLSGMQLHQRLSLSMNRVVLF